MAKGGGSSSKSSKKRKAGPKESGLTPAARKFIKKEMAAMKTALREEVRADADARHAQAATAFQANLDNSLGAFQTQVDNSLGALQAHLDTRLDAQDHTLTAVVRGDRVTAATTADVSQARTTLDNLRDRFKGFDKFTRPQLLTINTNTAKLDGLQATATRVEQDQYKGPGWVEYRMDAAKIGAS